MVYSAFCATKNICIAFYTPIVPFGSIRAGPIVGPNIDTSAWFIVSSYSYGAGFGNTKKT